MKKVQIYPSIEGVHTVYQSLLDRPPEGYEFIGKKDSAKRKFLEGSRNYAILKHLYHGFVNVFKTTAIFDSLNETEILPEADMVFSMGYLYRGELPWVIDILDSPYCLAGHNYEIFMRDFGKIQEVLERDNCKKILCSHETSLDMMKKFFSEKVLEKTVLVRPGINLPEQKEKKDSDKFRILFMGSISNPKDFYVKGGLETIKVFEKIQEKYDAELVIRCYVPEELKQSVINNKGIRLIEDKIPFAELVEIYRSSDVLLLPSHQYVLMAVLESMSYGLPVIGLDTFAVKDYIVDGVNGFVVPKSRKISSYNYEGYPTNTRDKKFVSETKMIDEEVIGRLAEKVEFLINNPETKNEMGRNGMKWVNERFSIGGRNSILKEIFDEALA